MSGTCSLDTNDPEPRFGERDIFALALGIIIGLGVMAGVHVALATYADRTHESAVATMREADAVLLRTCRADVARYQEIADLEKALVAREVGR